MKLVYKVSGQEVQVGDQCTLSDGQQVVVESFDKPHKPDSEGRVSVVPGGEYYVGIIGARWVEREDRPEALVQAGA